MRLQILKNKKLIFGLILLLALGLRLYGIDWDQGHHLHPDERFLTMVATDIKWPESISQYFKTRQSPLNPRNNDYDFFVYGPLPIVITKLAAEVVNWGDYQHITLVGRFLVALADVGVIFILYKLTKKIWASLFYALMVLPIQLSHFFAVDPFLNFFLVLSFYAALSWSPLLVGLFMGMALSCKITAVLFLPIIFLVFLKRFSGNIKKILLITVYLLLITSVTARIFNPYSFVGLFRPNPRFIDNLSHLTLSSDSNTWFPPAIQWIKTKPIVFPAKNIFLWGLGIPLSIFVLMALLHYSFKALKLFFKSEKNLGERIIKLLDYETISIIWIVLLFVFQGTRFVKCLRYFLPIYPFLALISGGFVLKCFSKVSRILRLLIVISLFIYPLMFMSIYSQPHTRVQASKWIYENVAPGSTLSCELWDDCLPLPLDSNNSNQYKTESLAVFGADTRAKWDKIDNQLEKIDYLILSSGRAWEPIMANSDQYPQMAEFYTQLFNGKLDFKKVAEFISYPGLSIGGYRLDVIDDKAEESFTVYDHPKVMIFKKN